MAYSIDFRKKVLSIKKTEKLSFEKVAQRFGIGVATVSRWSNRIEPQTTRNKPTIKMDWEALGS
jgi:transposase